MAQLETRPLGRTGIPVTRLGYGAMEVRGPRIWRGRPVTDEEASSILAAVLDAGITFVDTANDYGLSEQYIGRFLANRRDEYALATKCGCTMVPAGDHDETPHTWTRDHLLWNIDDSLQKLRTDHVDLLQLHNPSVEQVEQGKLVDVLQEIKAAGKTRWIGISSTAPHLATFIAWGVFDTFQIPYSALERQHEQLIQRAHAAGAGTIVRGAWLGASRVRGKVTLVAGSAGRRLILTSSWIRARAGPSGSCASSSVTRGSTPRSSARRIRRTLRPTCGRRRLGRCRPTATPKQSAGWTKPVIARWRTEVDTSAEWEWATTAGSSAATRQPCPTPTSFGQCTRRSPLAPSARAIRCGPGRQA